MKQVNLGCENDLIKMFGNVFVKKLIHIWDEKVLEPTNLEKATLNFRATQNSSNKQGVGVKVLLSNHID